MRLFVVGREGQIARSLLEVAAKENDITVRCAGRPDTDLLRPESVTTAILQFRPDIVVNAAAYTAVDKAELEPDLAFAINREGAQSVAAAAAGQGVPIIHFSTDYVFDGTKCGFYEEDDIPNPQSIYGRSKLEGERAVISANAQSVILRTAWVYAPYGTNFVRTISRRLVNGEPLRVVNDQTGCPSYAPDIAAATLTLARQLIGTGWRPEFSGVTNMVGPDALTWYAFAREIAKGCAARGAPSGEINPITSSEYPTRAARPANSCLSTKRLQSVFDIRLRSMELSLADCIDRISHNG